MDIKQLRGRTGLSQKEFAEYFGMPVRTIQEWEQSRAKEPSYLISQLERAWNLEKKYKKRKVKPRKCTMTIKELRNSMEMSQSRFAAYFNISIRTVQEWEQNRKAPPVYLVPLLKNIWELEKKEIT